MAGLLGTGLDVRVRGPSAIKKLPTVDILQYSKRLQSITTTEEGVAATFADGTTEGGTLLIGAEGAHSRTRDWQFQASPQVAALQTVPISSFVALTKFNRELASSLRNIHPTYCTALNPSNVLTFFSLHDGAANDPAEWVFMILLSWPVSETDDHAALARDDNLLLDKVCALVEPLADPFKAMVRGIPRGTKTWYSSRMTYWPTRPWDNRGGRVTLAGDAAHALTFREFFLSACHKTKYADEISSRVDRGQGLGNAITDVAELQTHLRAMKAHTRDELAKAVGEYEKEVWLRGYEVVVQNRENTMALHDWEKVSQSALFVKGVKKDQSAPAAGE